MSVTHYIPGLLFLGFIFQWGADYPDERYMIFAADQNIAAAKGSIEWLVKHVKGMFSSEHLDIKLGLY